MLYIVGIGPGHKEYILPQAIKILSKCDLIIGFERALESFSDLKVDKKVVKTLKDIVFCVNSKSYKTYAVIASGDPTFYGITNYLSQNYNGTIEVIPGISSFQYLTCKLNKPWNNAYVGSLHGREDEFIDRVKNNKLSIWLTDTKNNPMELCKKLNDHSIDCNVFIGINLSYENEKIWCGHPKDYIEYDLKNKENEVHKELAVFIVEKK